MNGLPWFEHWWPWSRNRCPDRLDRGHSAHRWGRCELVRGHDLGHALEYGLEVIRWEVGVTAHGQYHWNVWIEPA